MIGIFDSGVGGLAIYKEIKKILPEARILYLADKENFPYGEKTDEKLKAITAKNVELLLKMGAKIIVVACNSATVSVISYLRSIFDIPIVGIEPAIKQASVLTKTNHVGLIATSATVNNHQNGQLIKSGQIVHKIHQGGLVEKIENDFANISDEYLIESVSDLLKQNTDVIVLGCTHYHFVKERLGKLFPKVTFLAPGKEVANRVVDIIKENKIKLSTGRDIFLVTGETESFIISLNRLLGNQNRDVRRV